MELWGKRKIYVQVGSKKKRAPAVSENSMRRYHAPKRMFRKKGLQGKGKK